MTDDLRALFDPHPVPPPDLADRAERAARGMARRRAAAGAVATVAAVAAVAVPLGITRDDAAPTAAPAGTPGPTPSRTLPAECADGGGRYFPPPSPPPRARSGADADWGYRGDADLRDEAAALGAGLEDVRPLFGQALPGGGTVLMAAGRRGSDWRLRYAATGTGAGSAEQALPALGPGTALSLVLAPAGPDPGPASSALAPATDPAAFLVVVAAPGTTRITYRSCEGPAGYLLRQDADADTAVLALRATGESPGELTVQGSGRTWAVGQPGTGYAGAFTGDPLDPIPVPAGYRAVGRVVSAGGGLEYRGERAENSRVLVRCWSPIQWGLEFMADPTGPIRCDGLVQVANRNSNFESGSQIAFPTPAGQARVLVVVPDR